MDFHPLIVHFPLVCIILAAIFDGVAHFTHSDHYHKTGLVLLIAGALFMIPAAYTGEAAAEIARKIPLIEEGLRDHEDLSTITLWSALLLAVARIHLVARHRYLGNRKLIHMILVTACAGLVSWGAYTGGHLVYKFGAGTLPVRQNLLQQRTY